MQIDIFDKLDNRKVTTMKNELSRKDGVKYLL